MLSLRSKRSKAQLFATDTVMFTVSHKKLIFIQVFLLTVLEQTCSPEEASYKQTEYVQQREGKIMFTHPQTFWHPKTLIFCCCFVRLMQVGNKSSVICLAESSQAVQTHPVLLCSCDQGDLVCPRNPCVYVSGLEVLRCQVKNHGMRSPLPPCESFIMVN